MLNGSTLLATLENTQTVRIWDPATGQCTVELTTEAFGSVSAMCSIPNSSRATLLATAGENEEVVRLWDTTSGRLTNEIYVDGRVDSVAAVPLHHSTTLLATAAGGGIVKLWNPISGDLINVIDTGRYSSVSLCVVPISNGTTLLATARSRIDLKCNKTVQLWDPISGQSIRTLTNRVDLIAPLCAVPVSGGATLLATAVDNGSVTMEPN